MSSKPTTNPTSANRHPAKEAKPRRKPQIGADGFGDGPAIREAIKNWESGRDDPTKRDKSRATSIHSSGSGTGPSGGCTATATWWAAWCQM